MVLSQNVATVESIHCTSISPLFFLPTNSRKHSSTITRKESNFTPLELLTSSFHPHFCFVPYSTTHLNMKTTIAITSFVMSLAAAYVQLTSLLIAPSPLLTSPAIRLQKEASTSTLAKQKSWEPTLAVGLY